MIWRTPPFFHFQHFPGMDVYLGRVSISDRYHRYQLESYPVLGRKGNLWHQTSLQGASFSNLDHLQNKLRNYEKMSMSVGLTVWKKHKNPFLLSCPCIHNMCPLEVTHPVVKAASKHHQWHTERVVSSAAPKGTIREVRCLIVPWMPFILFCPCQPWRQAGSMFASIIAKKKCIQQHWLLFNRALLHCP